MTIIAYNDPRQLPAGVILTAGINAAGQAQVFLTDSSGCESAPKWDPPQSLA